MRPSDNKRRNMIKRQIGLSHPFPTQPANRPVAPFDCFKINDSNGYASNPRPSAFGIFDGVHFVFLGIGDPPHPDSSTNSLGMQAVISPSEKASSLSVRLPVGFRIGQAFLSMLLVIFLYRSAYLLWVGPITRLCASFQLFNV